MIYVWFLIGLQKYDQFMACNKYHELCVQWSNYAVYINMEFLAHHRAEADSIERGPWKIQFFFTSLSTYNYMNSLKATV